MYNVVQTTARAYAYSIVQRMKGTFKVLVPYKHDNTDRARQEQNKVTINWNLNGVRNKTF